MLEIGINEEDDALLYILNKQTNFSDRIIKENINSNRLYYKLIINILGDINSIIRSKIIPNVKNSKIRQIKYDFIECIGVKINDLDDKYVYSFKVDLIEKLENEKYIYFENYNKDEINERILVESNIIEYNPKYGKLNDIIIDKLYKKYFSKKILSLSEKEANKKIFNRVEINDLNNIIDKKEINKYTFENRNYKDIENFKNSNFKFSKKMTEDRKKKIIYTANAIVHFDEVVSRNNKSENPFLKNEWFMGPIYAYDRNYKKFI